jgi:hypothetical protein
VTVIVAIVLWQNARDKRKSLSVDRFKQSRAYRVQDASVRISVAMKRYEKNSRIYRIKNRKCRLPNSAIGNVNEDDATNLMGKKSPGAAAIQVPRASSMLIILYDHRGLRTSVPIAPYHTTSIGRSLAKSRGT